MAHFIHGQVPSGCTRGLLRIVWDTLTQGPCHERASSRCPAKRGNPRSCGWSGTAGPMKC